MAFKEERIAYQTIVVIELKRILRIWSQTILPPAITSILLFFYFWSNYRRTGWHNKWL